MWLEVKFSDSKTGLATVGYRLYDNTGADTVARTTTGVVEVGFGAYGVEIATLAAGTVGIQWDTGEATPVYANENTAVVATIATIEARTEFYTKTLKNKRRIVKDGSSWYLEVYDDDDTAVIMKKLLHDYGNNDIYDMETGILAEEHKSSV